MRTPRQSQFVLWYGILCVGFWGGSQAAHSQAPAGKLLPDAGAQLMALANESRAQTGAGPLQWD